MTIWGMVATTWGLVVALSFLFARIVCPGSAMSGDRPSRRSLADLALVGLVTGGDQCVQGGVVVGGGA
jgi:hypothetical protein